MIEVLVDPDRAGDAGWDQDAEYVPANDGEDAEVKSRLPIRSILCSSSCVERAVHVSWSRVYRHTWPTTKIERQMYGSAIQRKRSPLLT